MEFSLETQRYLIDLGVCAIAHLGIIANRLRSNRKKSDVYLEHIFSHAFRPLYAIGMLGLLGVSPDIITPNLAASIGAATGFSVDGIIPAIKERSLSGVQWDQLIANLFGTAIYLTIAHIIK